MIVVNAVVKSTRYRYLWLKRVRGFDPSRHCARCLLGDYDRAFRFGRAFAPGDAFTARVDPDAAPYLYLCGVTPRWAENLHLAMRPAAGSTVEYEDANVRVVATGVERLAIPSTELDMPRAFATCRNYRFGLHYLGAASQASRMA